MPAHRVIRACNWPPLRAKYLDIPGNELSPNHRRRAMLGGTTQMKEQTPADALPRDAAQPGLSRRGFLKDLGRSAVTLAALGATNVSHALAEANAERTHGPEATPVTFTLNGQKITVHVEPRVTLLEALRGPAAVCSPKEACDRGACGACTVLLDGQPVYACAMLAIQAHGAEIITVEGLAQEAAATDPQRLTPLQRALVTHDGLQCGFCSPGMVLTLTALLRKNPQPTEDEVRRACAGNLCRCGSYPHIFAAVLSLTGSKPTARFETLNVTSDALA